MVTTVGSRGWLSCSCTAPPNRQPKYSNTRVLAFGFSFSFSFSFSCAAQNFVISIYFISMCLKIIKGKKKRRKFIDLEVGPTVRAAPYWRPIANSGQISHFIEEFGGDDNKNAYIYIHISADMNDIPRDTLYGKAESYITLV